MPENHIKLDDRRTQRLGFDEAVLSEHKAVDHLLAILIETENAGYRRLFTRLQPGQFEALPEIYRAKMDYDSLSQTAYFGPVPAPSNSARVAVVSAGTSDAAVSREAVRTLTYYGESCLEIADVGVAGLWRLLEKINDIRDMAIVITFAGMDAALPSVVGGLVPNVVIAVPTSTGYGMARHGETALRAALVSCAPGLLVVNVDNGFGAACAALRTLNAIRRPS